MKTCSICNKEIKGRIVRGYIADPGYETLRYSDNGEIFVKIVCPECNAELEKQTMMKEGYIGLYLYNKSIQDWYGILSFDLTRWSKTDCCTSKGKTHTRRDYWFVGPDQHEWHGFTYGLSEYVQCYRTKKIIK
jgi:hypothetical protein